MDKLLKDRLSLLSTLGESVEGMGGRACQLEALRDRPGIPRITRHDHRLMLDVQIANSLQMANSLHMLMAYVKTLGEVSTAPLPALPPILPAAPTSAVVKEGRLSIADRLRLIWLALTG